MTNSNGPDRAYRIAVVEDHLLQRRRTEELIRSQSDFTIVFSGETVPEFVEWLRHHSAGGYPHLLVLDLLVERQPSVDVAVVRALIQAGVRIVVLSALASPPLVRQIVQAGVSAIVGKRDSELDILDAIRAALRGQEWMTEELAVVIAGDPERPKLSGQEERALILYASGLTVAQIAAEMYIRPDTAKQYLDRVKAKYTAAGVPVRTKLDLARIAWTHGYADPTLPPNDP
ncbi:MAG TPA: response regulator transcription factor [Ilumatobacter sp.]|nr:response regulator transcription factor [Ilumatobacter sp.]